MQAINMLGEGMNSIHEKSNNDRFLYGYLSLCQQYLRQAPG